MTINLKTITMNMQKMTMNKCNATMNYWKTMLKGSAPHTFGLPEVYRCYNGIVVDSVEALCVCMKRFAYPCRYVDLVPKFGRPVPQLCMITNMMVDDLFDRYSHILRELDQPWLSPANLQMHATKVHNKGAALDNCWGFVDGTVSPICRPQHDQRAVYNGHKRVHAIKFQSVVGFL